MRPGAARTSRQRFDDLLERDVPVEQHRDDRQQIVDIEVADERTDQGARAPARVELELDAARREPDLHGAHETGGAARARLMAAAGDHDAATAARVEGELPAEGVVDIDHARHQVFAREQPRLGGAVAVHRAVIVEMIAREVGEHRGLEPHGTHARLVERMRGDFHRHVHGAFTAQLVQRALHGNRVTGGQRARGEPLRATGADGAHVARGPARGFERLRQ